MGEYADILRAAERRISDNFVTAIKDHASGRAMMTAAKMADAIDWLSRFKPYYSPEVEFMKADHYVKPIEPVDEDKEVVYIIRCATLLKTYYKIGYSTNVASRLDSLKTANPLVLELIATFSAKREFEKILHRRYDRYNTRLEWFELPAEVVAFLASISDQAKKPQPPESSANQDQSSAVAANG